MAPNPRRGKWNANSKDIAAFLSGANPHWPKADIEAMLQKTPGPDYR